ncbi:MAG: hypothetical protein QG585_602 [Patescibacteria group bacterium]|jgi:hypothetical protein|nr:hypothetical protein [Patescibacteria group bacterium]
MNIYNLYLWVTVINVAIAFFLLVDSVFGYADSTSQNYGRPFACWSARVAMTRAGWFIRATLRMWAIGWILVGLFILVMGWNSAKDLRVFVDYLDPIMDTYEARFLARAHLLFYAILNIYPFVLSREIRMKFQGID